jgi:hypothetical protein
VHRDPRVTGNTRTSPNTSDRMNVIRQPITTSALIVMRCIQGPSCQIYLKESNKKHLVMKGRDYFVIFL